ncbi:hypothetical protein ACJJTC_013402 [Scirpophaga incertulas]
MFDKLICKKSTHFIFLQIKKLSLVIFKMCKCVLWFSSLEAQFHINGITQEVTKYHFAISHLDMECIREKVRRLLESEPIGDRKPSSFLRHLCSLAGPSFAPEQLLKTIWLNRLPRHVQLILASRKEQNLEDLWDLVDQLMEITSHNPSAPITFEVSSSQAATPIAADFQDLGGGRTYPRCSCSHCCRSFWWSLPFSWPRHQPKA